MILHSAEFIISAVRLDQCPTSGEAEFAFVGRSNVGKSSLLNKLLNRRNLARISGSPGKTQTLNFYHINDSFYFVDLPGYGYAKVSKQLRAKWGPMVEEYLIKRDTLIKVIQLVDVRHEPSRDDQLMYEWLCYNGRQPQIVATKADKIARGSYGKQIQMIAKTLKMDPVASPILLTSADTGYGIDLLWSAVDHELQAFNKTIETE
ncbi:MAG: ribosome biogenesis GTP-binding protein YihA/YsxC [Acidibacillus sp.]|uniref:Probable GTP-binding protein EngB n=1 Tax=Sulfoacidibacillus ferrooxidans TaxID=2005001 RepID=A0A9X1V8R1_9BACL|nr:ribosome biogenesis GTP-binding protein YihA/YsxC [Sulfoacidibacillus ferrooxidans]MCI0183212.1 putative GTP-binding protein EngB [Sulfoacidibacillus ferrooxidans]MCY0893079.1 ribosome biogenesis GTP-binding protein YihA/YsxC [Acidibacillus sp.]